MPPPAINASLQILVNTRRPLVVMSWLTILGLAFWLLICTGIAFGAYGRVAEGSYSVAVAVLTWSLIGVPVLLHIWPILELRRSAKIVTAFALSPSDQTAVIAVRAQRLYWRAAAICHLSLIAWIVFALIALRLVIAWENSQPETLHLLDATR